MKYKNRYAKRTCLWEKLAFIGNRSVRCEIKNGHINISTRKIADGLPHCFGTRSIYWQSLINLGQLELFQTAYFFITVDSGRQLNASSCDGCTMTFLGRFSKVSRAWLQCLFSKFKRCN